MIVLGKLLRNNIFYRIIGHKLLELKVYDTLMFQYLYYPPISRENIKNIWSVLQKKGGIRRPLQRRRQLTPSCQAFFCAFRGKFDFAKMPQIRFFPP